MANSDFFSNMMGFSSKYAESSKSQVNDETDYEDVDFCQGEEIKGENMSVFGEFEEYTSNGSSDLFSFDSDSNDEDFLF